MASRGLRAFWEKCTVASNFEIFNVAAIKAELVARDVDTNGLSKDQMIDVLIKNNQALSLYGDSEEEEDAQRQQPIMTMTVQDMSHRIKDFDGEIGKPIKMFLESIQRVANQQRWDEATKLSVAGNHLVDNAKKWQNHTGSRIKTWVAWEMAFRRRFERKPTLMEWNKAVAACVQQKGEKLSTYADRKLEQLRKPPLGDNLSLEDIVGYITSGFVDFNIRILLKRRQFLDVDDFFELLTDIDMDPKTAADKTSGGMEPGLQMKPVQTSLAKTEKGATVKTARVYLPCPRCKSTDHGVWDCLIPCKCGKTGHSRINCPLQQGGGQLPAALCLLRTTRAESRLPVVMSTIFDSGHVEALIDGGCQISVVDSRHLPRDVKINKYEGSSIQMLENVCSPVGQVDLQIVIGDYETSFGPVAVVNWAPFPVILGGDWRQAVSVRVCVDPSGDVELIPMSDRKEETSTCMVLTQRPKVSSFLMGEMAAQEESFGLEVTQQQRGRFRALVMKYPEAFSTPDNELGHFSGVEHSIRLRDDVPVARPPYREAPRFREFVKMQVQKWIDLDIVRQSCSEYAAPVIVVEQPFHPTTSQRLVVNYMELNKKLIKDSYPSQYIEDVLNEMVADKAEWFNTMDIRTAFMTIKIKEEDIHKSAFITQDGLYEFKRMPFGLATAPATLQRVMNRVFKGVHRTVVYMDDIAQSGRSVDEMLDGMEEVFLRLAESGLRVALGKCQLMQKEVKFLGYIVSGRGKLPDPERTAAVSRYNSFPNKRSAKSFLAFVSHYRKFIKSFASIANPIQRAVNEIPFSWSTEAETAATELKSKLMSPPILGHFDPKAPTEVWVDASTVGLGAILVQQQNKREVTISFASRALSKAEKNIHINELESLAVHWAITEKFRIYLYGGDKFVIITDNWTTACLLDKKKLSRKFARWLLDLEQFDYTVKHRAGSKNVCADALSRTPEFLTLTLVIMAEDTRMGQAQTADADCSYIKMVCLAEAKTAKQRDIQGKFIWMDGLLQYKGKSEGYRRIVIPRKMRRAVMEMGHDESGHMDNAKTFHKICKRYYWEDMRKEVEDYVKSCEICQVANRRTFKRIGYLGAREVPSRPMTVLSMDHEQMPQAAEGKKWILVIIDHTTRFIFTKAMADVSTRRVIEMVETQIINVMGPPELVITDNATSFTSGAFQEFMMKFGIQHTTSPAYWAESNGVVERAVGTVAASLRKRLLDGRDKNWVRVLPEITFDLNASRHSTSGYTPFFLMFGFEPRMRDEVRLGVHKERQTVEERIQEMEEVRSKAKEKLKKNQRRQQERINESRQPAKYEVGDTLYVEEPIRLDKMQRVYDEETYKVKEKLGDSVYLVSRWDELGREKVKKVHAGQTRPHHRRIENWGEIPESEDWNLDRMMYPEDMEERREVENQMDVVDERPRRKITRPAQFHV